MYLRSGLQLDGVARGVQDGGPEQEAQEGNGCPRLLDKLGQRRKEVFSVLNVKWNDKDQIISTIKKLILNLLFLVCSSSSKHFIFNWQLLNRKDMFPAKYKQCTENLLDSVIIKGLRSKFYILRLLTLLVLQANSISIKLYIELSFKFDFQFFLNKITKLNNFRTILFQLYCDFQWDWLACYENTTFSCTSEDKKEEILEAEKKDFRFIEENFREMGIHFSFQECSNYTTNAITN